jgi:hypothetical protein
MILPQCLVVPASLIGDSSKLCARLDPGGVDPVASICRQNAWMSSGVDMVMGDLLLWRG